MINPNWQPDVWKWINISSAAELSAYRILTSKKGKIQIRIMNECGEWAAVTDVDASVFSGSPIVGFTNAEPIAFPQMNSEQILNHIGLFVEGKILTVFPCNNRIKVEIDQCCLFACGALEFNLWGAD